jgi:transglutaminase/protease-like cytokinesis protein 3
MMGLRALGILAFVLWFISADARLAADYSKYNYSEVDRHALTYRNRDFGSISKLADSLTAKFSEEHQKARAIYRWITDNIAYDCKAYHNPGKRTDDYEEVLKKRKAVCAGYASLFKVLCDYAGLDCEIVKGYVRNTYRGIGDERIEDNHAWNAVRLNDKWYLVDVTWGSGYTDEKVKRFTKSYSDNYFLTDPKLFILSHYPNNKKWQLLDRTVSKKKFLSFPYVWDGYYDNKVVAFAPRKGIIRTGAGNPVHFRFKTENDIKITSVSVYTDFDQKPEEVKVKMTRKGISFKYTFPKKGDYYISLALNSEHTILYKVIAR